LGWVRVVCVQASAEELNAEVLSSHAYFSAFFAAFAWVRKAGAGQCPWLM
jgi:hypothetical protein